MGARWAFLYNLGQVGVDGLMQGSQGHGLCFLMTVDGGTGQIPFWNFIWARLEMLLEYKAHRREIR